MTEREGRLISREVHSALSDVVAGLARIDTHALDPASRLQFDRAQAAADLLTDLTPNGAAQRQAPGPERGTTGAEIGPLLDRLTRRWRGHAAAQGAEFLVETGVAPGLRLDAPPLSVERILSNLIENAVQHAPYGRVTLSVRQEPRGVVQCAVIDEGPGFSNAALGQLFAGGRMPGVVPEPGTGQGLHTAKLLALELGGDLTVYNVRSAGGELSGACATLSLRALSQESHGQPTGERHLSGMRVLLADSDRASRQVVAGLLRDLGASCTAVATGEDAYRALRQKSFDVAILDALLPRSGPETIQRMRQLPGTRGQVPILVVTCSELDEESLRLFDAGADTLIAKPIAGAADLFDTMWATLHDAKGRWPVQRPFIAPETCAAPATSPARPSWMPAPRPASPAGAAPGDVLADRLDHLVDIAGPTGKIELIERLSSDLARCRANLATAFYERDLRGIRAQTHILISLTGAVGATRLHAAVRMMNMAAHDGDWSRLHGTMSQVWPDLEAVCEEVRATRSDLSAAAETEVRPA